MRQHIKKWWRLYLGFGFWLAVTVFDTIAHVWGWLAFHTFVGLLAVAIGDLSARYSNGRDLKKAIAAWGGNEPDIETEAQMMVLPPRDWHIEVRGERFENIDLVYLGPTLREGQVVPHWQAIKPLNFPDDVDPSEIEIVGSVAEPCRIVLWMAPPEG